MNYAPEEAALGHHFSQPNLRWRHRIFAIFSDFQHNEVRFDAAHFSLRAGDFHHCSLCG
jgi:hypothetical protein